MILCSNEPFDFCQCPQCGPFATAIVPLYPAVVGSPVMCKGCRCGKSHCAGFDGFDGGGGGGDDGDGEPLPESVADALYRKAA